MWLRDQEKESRVILIGLGYGNTMWSFIPAGTPRIQTTETKKSYTQNQKNANYCTGPAIRRIQPPCPAKAQRPLRNSIRV